MVGSSALAAVRVLSLQVAPGMNAAAAQQVKPAWQVQLTSQTARAYPAWVIQTAASAPEATTAPMEPVQPARLAS